MPRVKDQAYNLEQLNGELGKQGVSSKQGLTYNGRSQMLLRVNPQGQIEEFTAAERPTVMAVTSAHVATRPKNAAEYRTEYFNPHTTKLRQDEIVEILCDLRDREPVVWTIGSMFGPQPLPYPPNTPLPAPPLPPAPIPSAAGATVVLNASESQAEAQAESA